MPTGISNEAQSPPTASEVEEAIRARLAKIEAPQELQQHVAGITVRVLGVYPYGYESDFYYEGRRAGHNDATNAVPGRLWHDEWNDEGKRARNAYKRHQELFPHQILAGIDKSLMTFCVYSFLKMTAHNDPHIISEIVDALSELTPGRDPQEILAEGWQEGFVIATNTVPLDVWYNSWNKVKNRYLSD